MTPPSLSNRFAAFVETLDLYESVDSLLQGNDPQGMKRADYLLGNRQFIIEQKALVSNPASRPQRFVDKLAVERGFVFMGTLSTDYIFSRQPDPQELQKRMVLDLARVIDDIVANADKQTADTRTIFNIPDAVGILVILNESAAHLPPDVIHYALANTFQKKTPQGAFRYSANNGVILFSEAHTLVAPGLNPGPMHPILPFISPDRKHSAAFSEFAEMLVQRWTAFNNAPLITMPVDVNLKPK